MNIQIGDIQIPVKVQKARGRSISMRFLPEEAAILVRTPSGQLSPSAEAFILQKKKWILKQWNKGTQIDQRKEDFFRNLQEGRIPYLGREYKLRIQTHTRPNIHHQAEQETIILNIPDNSTQEEINVYLKQGLRMIAGEHLTARTLQLAETIGLSINKIFIKSQKTRWGSCSTNRNINLNWHLIFLAEPLIDYVIIHELMHLKEMNHSPDFWNWVGHFYPNYKQAEKEIRQQEWLIGILD